MARRAAQPAPAARLLTEEAASAYLGAVPLAEVRRQGIGLLRLGSHERYDLRAIDAHLDRLSGLTPQSPDAPSPPVDDPEAALDRFVNGVGRG